MTNQLPAPALHREPPEAESPSGGLIAPHPPSVPLRADPGRGARPAQLDWPAIRTLLARDLGAVRRAKAVMLPMLLVPALVLVALPLTIGLAANRGGVDATRLIDLMPDALAGAVRSHAPDGQLLVLVLGYLVAPLFLIVPLMVSAVLRPTPSPGRRSAERWRRCCTCRCDHETSTWPSCSRASHRRS